MKAPAGCLAHSRWPIMDSTRSRLVAASLLLAALAVFPPAQHRAAAQALDFGTCEYKGRPGHDGHGVILRFLTPEQAKRLIAKSQAIVHSTINLRYLENTRVIIGLPDGRQATALLPETMIAKPGDDVAFTGGHQTPGDPCSYIPNLVTRIIPPAGGDKP